MKKLLFLLLVIVYFFVFLAILEMGIEKQEKFECYQWQKQAKEFPGFYLTEWQREQCEHYNIKVGN